jgi:hypothetical protein
MPAETERRIDEDRPGPLEGGSQQLDRPIEEHGDVLGGRCP